MIKKIFGLIPASFSSQNYLNLAIFLNVSAKCSLFNEIDIAVKKHIFFETILNLGTLYSFHIL